VGSGFKSRGVHHRGVEFLVEQGFRPFFMSSKQRQITPVFIE
jgi:hypothetical protein